MKKIRRIKEDEGLTWDELCAILDEEEEEAKKVTTGLPSHSRRRVRSKKRTPKQDTLETSVPKAVETAIISTKL